MRSLEGNQTRMRVYTTESKHVKGRPLFEFLVHLCREHKIAGVTVIRGMMGFGAKAHLHAAAILRLSENLPVVVEIVDTEEHIQRLLPLIDENVHSGLITLEPVHVRRYLPKGS